MAAALAAVLPPGAAAGTPGRADSVQLRLDAPTTFVMYNADEGAGGENGDFRIPVAVVPGNTAPARNIRLVVDASGLRGVARVGRGSGGNCTGGGWVWTCAYGSPQNDGESTAPFTLYGVDGVRPGDSGTVTYTATADNAAPVTGVTRMTVGGPTLHTARAGAAVTGVTPGRTAALTPAFANHSRFTAERGVALHLTAQGGLLVTSRPRNCSFDPAYVEAWCLFPTKAAPGSAYRTRAPLGFTAAPRELTGLLSYRWSSDPRRPAGLTVRGTDAPLTLTPTGGAGLTEESADVAVETTVQADYAPVTGTVRGRVGDTVTVRLGVRDLGPGALGGERGRFEVVPPEGTTVTSVPYTVEDREGTWACQRPERPGGAFVCDLDRDAFPPGDGATTIGFRFRVDRRVPGARGTIRVYNPWDRTPGNDTAAIPLEASPAPAYRTRPFRWGLGGAAGAAAVVGLVLLLRRVRRRRSA